MVSFAHQPLHQAQIPFFFFFFNVTCTQELAGMI